MTIGQSHLCYAPTVKTIAHRDLRNQSGRVLREAQAGERFVVTVGGRPVAVLGPLEPRAFVPTRQVREGLRTITPDAGFAKDARRLGGRLNDTQDPWRR